MGSKAKEHTLKVQKTARFYTLEPMGEHRADLLAIHGYRQLGKYFIHQFSALTKLGVRVIVPEGLHRFYIDGYSGRVGASWMTKEDRLSDIDDYIAYLSRLYESMELGKVPLHILGFSQGGPTACRWLASTEVAISSLILHSTVFPNDFDFEGQRDRLREIPSFAIFGDDDPFASEATIQEKMAWMEAKGIAPVLLRFKGGHVIHINSMMLIFNRLID
ncbi:MAG: phospholipase [Flavobacteriales bacterium]|nr:phospholipase [Flavobacteriales bacterium]